FFSPGPSPASTPQTETRPDFDAASALFPHLSLETTPRVPSASPIKTPYNKLSLAKKHPQFKVTEAISILPPTIPLSNTRLLPSLNPPVTQHNCNAAIFGKSARNKHIPSRRQASQPYLPSRIAAILLPTYLSLGFLYNLTPAQYHVQTRKPKAAKASTKSTQTQSFGRNKNHSFFLI